MRKKLWNLKPRKITIYYIILIQHKKTLPSNLFIALSERFFEEQKRHYQEQMKTLKKSRPNTAEQKAASILTTVPTPVSTVSPNPYVS